MLSRKEKGIHFISHTLSLNFLKYLLEKTYALYFIPNTLQLLFRYPTSLCHFFILQRITLKPPIILSSYTIADIVTNPVKKKSITILLKDGEQKKMVRESYKQETELMRFSMLLCNKPAPQHEKNHTNMISFFFCVILKAININRNFSMCSSVLYHIVFLWSSAQMSTRLQK